MKGGRAFWGAVLGLLGIALVPGCVRSIDSGRAGVLWTMTGGTQPEVYGEGVHLIAPWNKLTAYDVRTQDRKEVLHVLTNNGLSVSLEASIRYRPLREELPRLHAELGPDYFDVILAPVVRSEARKVGGRYAPEEIYSSKREVVEKEIVEEVQHAVQGKHVELEAVLIRDVDLPENIKRAISEKLEEEQRALKMQFTLARERQEAERKRIEAEGIADFQKIVATGISPELLRWKGIEATEKLASSSNAKVVVIGSQKDGLPLILGGGN
ncbi:MAG TPA: prohibitin family protein [Myxococcota bacterium]|nr:prohibitin family protein [Myxococcota bacterium]